MIDAFALVFLLLLGREDPLTGGPVDCAGGLQVSADAGAPVQGDVVMVELRGLEAVDDVRASWDGKPIPLWREDPEGPWRALLGIDVEHAEGPALLRIERAQTSPCTFVFQVKAGDFGVRRLTVARRFVELSPKDRARSEREARQLEELFATVAPERLWRDRFTLPVAQVEPSRNFGQKRILNGEPRSPHSGVDFPAAPGAPVHAPQRGRVALVSTFFFSGRTVVLDHGLGLFSFYGHLSAVAVRAGTVVEAGARLGSVGASGRVTGPHLHWSVRLGGARVDPLDLVAASR